MSENHNNQRPSVFSAFDIVPILTFSTIVVLTIVFYYVSTTFDTVPPLLRRGMQPATFPQILLIIIAGLSIVMLFESRVRLWPQNSALPKVFYLSMLGLVIFIFVAEFIDFFIALALFSGAIAFLWGEKRLLMLSSVGIIFPAFIGFLFNYFLNIRFPRGILTNLFY